MLNEAVYKYLEKQGYADRITEHTELIDTVEHAAQQIGCTEAEIAKTLSFIVDEKPVVVVMAGDGRVNSSKFKGQFHTKPSMVPRDQVETVAGDLFWIVFVSEAFMLPVFLYWFYLVIAAKTTYNRNMAFANVLVFYAVLYIVKMLLPISFSVRYCSKVDAITEDG